MIAVQALQVTSASDASTHIADLSQADPCCPSAQQMLLFADCKLHHRKLDSKQSSLFVSPFLRCCASLPTGLLDDVAAWCEERQAHACTRLAVASANC